MTASDPEFAPTVDSNVTTATTVKPERLLSIDVLRGLTIAFMIVVNNQTGRAPFQQLMHAKWNGFTATDLVFPTFLMLVGLSTVLSTASRLARGASRGELFLHSLRRAALLVVFGFVVNNFPFTHLATARYFGVLPRIAICYFVVSTLYLLSPAWKDKVVLIVILLIAYWALMRFVPVPGFGTPTHDVTINDRDGNLSAWLDRQIFSASHLYGHTFDPEGLLSTLPSIATALLGLLTGIWLRTKHSTGRKAALLAAAGLVSLGAAMAWDPFFPINKKLWTSSFVLFAGGWSFLLLAATIHVVDLWRLGRGKANATPTPAQPPLYAPILVFGTNAILAYMISELGATILRLIHPYSGATLKQAITGAIAEIVSHPGWASLLYSVLFLLICWLAVLPFYRKKIFLRV
jgi:predicted acyltransferase